MSAAAGTEPTMPDQATLLSLPAEHRTDFTPEERAQLEALMAETDRKLDRLEASADRTLILLGIKP